jgi:hypothetical protein
MNSKLRDKLVKFMEENEHTDFVVCDCSADFHFHCKYCKTPDYNGHAEDCEYKKLLIQVMQA